jgi:hypothetical protein
MDGDLGLPGLGLCAGDTLGAAGSTAVLGARGPSVISGVGPGSGGNARTSYRSARGRNTRLGNVARNLVETVLVDNITREDGDRWFGWGTHGSAALGSRGIVFDTGRGVPITGAGNDGGGLHAGEDVDTLGMGFKDDDLGAKLVKWGGKTIDAGGPSLVRNSRFNMGGVTSRSSGVCPRRQRQ